MRRCLAALALAIVCWSVCAQPTAPAGTISRPPDRANNPSSASQSGVDDATFTNSNGTFTVGQLAAQLHRLRSTVDEVLPTLVAFIESSSNSVPAGQRTLGGTLSSILSGILNRNTNSTPESPQGSTNLVSVLQRILGTNALAGPAANERIYEEILNLQSSLQAIPGILESLSVTGTSTNLYSSPTDKRDRRLTPTGR